MSDKPKGIQEGPAIWIESVLSNEEWKEGLKKYPNTSHIKEKPQFFKSDYEWRWRMGDSIPADQIKLMNSRLDELRKQVSKTM